MIIIMIVIISMIIIIIVTIIIMTVMIMIIAIIKITVVINHHRDHNAPCLYSTKYYITIVSNFSWVLQSSQEKLKNLGGKQSLWSGENGQCTARRTLRLS